MKKLIWFIIALAYCASPVDLFPGPIDDAIVCFIVAIIMSHSGNNSGGNITDTSGNSMYLK